MQKWWEGQGTVIDSGGGRSTPEDAPNNVAWGDVGYEVLDVLCAIKPEWCKTQPETTPIPSPNQTQRQRNNMIWWVAGAIGLVVIILLIVLIARK